MALNKIEMIDALIGIINCQEDIRDKEESDVCDIHASTYLRLSENGEEFIPRVCDEVDCMYCPLHPTNTSEAKEFLEEIKPFVKAIQLIDKE
ncbi:hypothetical protein [Marinobacterium litorale]|uniref:hypothetical protein n=1 Tax=Marinobacterium litorale TaxID=404770 RepID=UPI0004833232|nr:hypothetical protein [Marinobacterium litorale]